MKRFIYLALSLVCLAGALALLSGCATNPTTGKAEFSPTVAYQATTQPAVQAIAAATLPPWGSVILGGLSLAFLALAHTSTSATAKQAITSLENVVTAVTDPTPATSTAVALPASPAAATTTTTVAAK